MLRIRCELEDTFHGPHGWRGVSLPAPSPLHDWALCPKGQGLKALRTRMAYGLWHMPMAHGGTWHMAHGLWRMGYGLRYPDLPLSEHCKPILLPGGDRALGCPPGSPGATHRGTWVAFGSPSPARHRGLGANGSATPAARPSAVLWGRRRPSSPSSSPIIVSRFLSHVGTRLLPSSEHVLLLWRIPLASSRAWLVLGGEERSP